MKSGKISLRICYLLYFLASILIVPLVFAQEQAVTISPQDAEVAPVVPIENSDKVTLDFKDADIHSVLRILALKGNVNIVTTPDVAATVTIRLNDVSWDKALEVLLKTYGFASERIGNVITVSPLDKMTEQKKAEAELAQVQPVMTEVFEFKYVDSYDAKSVIEPQLSPRGKVSVLEMKGQAGWEFGSEALGKRKRSETAKSSRSKTLVVSDIPPAIERINEIVKLIDVMPKQILIETRIMEVNRDKLIDLGIDIGTGTGGAENAQVTQIPYEKLNGNTQADIGGHALATVTPSIFNPKGTAITAANTGLKLIFRRLTGSQFEIMIHALEEDVRSNTLSAPHIMTLNNQEATILVGKKYPILKSEESTQSQYTVSQTLDYYQDIGIQLNVVPQVAEGKYINMVVHPAVTDYTNTVGTNLYPIITTREAETRVLIEDGETIVIGGLLKDVKSHEVTGIPIISNIPFLGPIFQRHTTDTEKIDLLIFITAHIMKDEKISPEQVKLLEERIKKGYDTIKEARDKKRKKKVK